MAQKVESYIKGTNDFLCKLDILPCLQGLMQDLNLGSGR